MRLLRKNAAATVRQDLAQLLAFGVPTRLYSGHGFDPAWKFAQSEGGLMKRIKGAWLLLCLVFATGVDCAAFGNGGALALSSASTSPQKQNTARSRRNRFITRQPLRNTTTRLVLVPLLLLSTPQQLAVLVNC